MKQPYQRHKAAKEVYQFLRGLYNTLDRATRMDANGAKGIFIVRTEADDLKAATKTAADKLQSLLEHWSSADTGDTAGDVAQLQSTIDIAKGIGLDLTKIGNTHGDTDSGGRNTRSPKRSKS